MSLTLNDLLPASFRGVPFLVNDTTTQGGAKQVVHEYPNDSRRFVEDLGPLKKTFNLTGIISGDLYLVNRAALQAALEDGSIGILVHPTHGAFAVAPRPYTLRESTSKLGEAVFDMTFMVADLPINPADSGSIIAQIIAAIESVDSNAQAAFLGAFSISRAFPRNYGVAKTKLATIGTGFDAFKGFFGKSTDVTNLAAEQQTFSANLDANIRQPAVLAGAISSIFDVANGVSDDPKLTGKGFQGLFGFGAGDALIPQVPLQALERSKNNLIINYTFNVYALIYAYLNFSQAAFDDDVELDTISAQLEQQYLKIISGKVTGAQTVNASDVLTDDVLLSLETMRNLVRRQFNSDAVNVAKISTITINTPLSASLISYQYYGETSEADQIINLNNIADVSFISGPIQVRTGI